MVIPMNNYAIVEASVVTNIIVWDGNDDVKSGGWVPPTDVKAIKIDAGVCVRIGYAYDGTSFSAPVKRTT